MMQLAEAQTWHYVVALVLFFVLGIVAHVFRAVFNVLPDRLSDNDRMDMIISDGYSYGDYLFGTEYDYGGYYRLDSLKNLRLSCIWTVVGGMAVMLLSPGASSIIAAAIDMSLRWFWDLFIFRLQNLTWY